MVIHRFEVWLVNLDPTLGREIKKTRPCAVVSPDVMNRHAGTVLVAPMTSHLNAFPTRIACTFQGTAGQIALDQMRAVDKARLVKNLGTLSKATQGKLLDGLAELFAP